MPFDASIAEKIATSLAEIPHPSLPKGSNLYGSTKIFPDYQAEEGESYFTLVHGIAHESSVAFVAVLQATSIVALAGVTSEGLATAVLPAASAGAIFQVNRYSGRFHGDTVPTTPSGLRRV